MVSQEQDQPQSNSGIDLNSIDSGISEVASKQRPDARDLLEAEEAKAAELRNKLTASQIKDRKADRKLRKSYASKILRYLQVYSACVFLLLLMSGWKLWSFDLPKETEVALTGSTALAAIGLVGFIAKGLFK